MPAHWCVDSHASHLPGMSDMKTILLKKITHENSVNREIVIFEEKEEQRKQEEEIRGSPCLSAMP